MADEREFDKKIVGGTGITAGGDINISGISGQISIGQINNQILKDEKKREKLEGYLQEHSKNLVEGPIKNWYERHDGGGRSSEQIDEMIGMIIAIYRPPTKSKIIDREEPGCRSVPYIPKYANFVIDHLKSGYTDNVDTWLDCKNITRSYLEKKFNIYEKIEEKILANIPEDFTNFIDKNEHTSGWYLLPFTIWEIYEAIENFIIKGEQSRFEIRQESDRIEISIKKGNKVIAQCHEENMAQKFIELVNIILIDKDLIEQIKLCIAIKKLMVEKTNQFYQEFDRIIDDFENGHINLKGTCNRCKSWHDEIEAIKTL